MSRSPSRLRLTLLRLAPSLIALLAACGGKSCSCLGPIKGGFPIDDRRHENAMQLRVTSGAIDWLQQNLQPLVAGALGGMSSTFNVPPSCGGKNQICCGSPAPMCRVQLDIDQKTTTLALQPPNVLQVDVSAAVKTLDKLPIDYDTGFAGTAHCFVSIDTSASTTQYKTIELVTDATFTVDGTTKLTRVDLANTQVNHLDKSMLTLESQPSDTFRLCSLAGNVSQIQDYIVKQLASQLKSQIDTQAANAFCAKCTTLDDCDGWADACTSGQCQRGGKCLQEIGVQGRLDVGALFANLSPNTVAGLDTLAVLGSYADVTPSSAPGLSLGLVGGGQADPHSACVPMRTPPAAMAVPEWSAHDGEVEPQTMKPYHVGIAIHQSHLDQMAFAAFDAGALCLDVGTPQQALLTTQTLSVLMPSLADLTHDTVAPMYLAIRPTQPPTITLGAGTFKTDMSGNKTIDDALLHVDAPGFGMDFYAFLDDRYVRVMTLTADVKLGVSLDVDSSGHIVPLFGDLKQAFTNLTVTNSELLAEPPAMLAKSFPMLLSIAFAQIGSALKPIAIPATNGIQLQIVAIEPTDNQTNLGIFANLSTAMPAPLTWTGSHATAHATLTEVSLPPTELFAVTRREEAARPRVTLALDGESPTEAAFAGPLEWSWSLDDGAWSPYQTGRAPTVSDERLWLEGRHHLDVRARVVGRPETAGEAVRVEFLVDTIAPVPEVGVANGRPVLTARDNVTPRERLEYSLLVDGTWTEWSTETRHVAWDAIGGARVRDEAGNVAPVETAFHGRKTAGSSGGCGGCALGGQHEEDAPAAALATATLWLLGFALGRRRARNASARRCADSARGAAGPLALLVAATLGGSACNGDYTLQPNDEEPATDEIGRFDSVVVDEKGLTFHVAAYDDTMGDLAYAQIPVANVGMPIQWQWVDGVPAGVADMPKASRRGTTDPGDDVGRGTSIALTKDGFAVIAYYDVTNRRLKLARGSIHDRKFSVSVIDAPGSAGGAAAATVGLYPSLSLDAAGVPSVAYAVTGLPSKAGDGFVSRLRLATAKSALPTGPSDWTTQDLDETPISCAGSGKQTLCGASSACVVMKMHDPSTSLCRPVDTSCTMMCAKGTACVGGQCVAVLVPSSAPDLVEGTGLFANLVRLSSGSRAVVYYDREQGDLKLALESGSGFTKGYLDGNDPTTDVGQFASAAVGADDTVHVAYVDAIGDRLLYLEAVGLAPGKVEVVDDGMRSGSDGGPHPVGGGAALALDGSDARILYQDQATADLWLATRSGGSWAKTPVRSGAPGYGFAPHLVSLGGKRYVVEFVYDRAATNGPLGSLEVKALP